METTHHRVDDNYVDNGQLTLDSHVPTQLICDSLHYTLYYS